MSAFQFHIRRIAMVRRAVRELAVIAEQRVARARSNPRRDTFRPLSEGEPEAIVGADLLAQVAVASDRS